MDSFPFITVIWWILVNILFFGDFLCPTSAQTPNDISIMCNFSTDQFITYYGYEAEVHSVTTADGYILKIFRCYSKKFANIKRHPVLLAHGLLTSSDVYVIQPGDQSLAYFLADRGYDVWLPNYRGYRYSRKHVSKNPDDPASGFWNFTWTEMGLLDNPTSIDYILAQTNFKKLNYIGHSSAATALFVLLSKRPDYNRKINIASLLAPIAFVKHVGIKTRALFDGFLSLRGKINTEFQLTNSFDRELFNSFCPNSDTCDIGSKQMNMAFAPIFKCRGTGTSMNTLMHYAEEVKYGFFGEFVPNTIDPEAFRHTCNFPLSRISAPITIHLSTGDKTTNKADIAKLRSKVKSIVYKQTVDDPTFAHTDFLNSANANKLVYKYIAKFWQKFKRIDERHDHF